MHFNLLKFFINFSGQIRTKSGAKIKILCNRFLDFKIAYDGGIEKFTLYFCRKIFSIFQVGFKRNLNQILKIVKIEIVNIKERPTEVAKKLHYIPWGLN